MKSYRKLGYFSMPTEYSLFNQNADLDIKNQERNLSIKAAENLIVHACHLAAKDYEAALSFLEQVAGENHCFWNGTLVRRFLGDFYNKWEPAKEVGFHINGKRYEIPADLTRDCRFGKKNMDKAFYYYWLGFKDGSVYCRYKLSRFLEQKVKEMQDYDLLFTIIKKIILYFINHTLSTSCCFSLEEVELIYETQSALEQAVLIMASANDSKADSCKQKFDEIRQIEKSYLECTHKRKIPQTEECLYLAIDRHYEACGRLSLLLDQSIERRYRQLSLSLLSQ